MAHNFIEFQAVTGEHIQVAENLNSGCPQQQVPSFQNEFDQTDLRSFEKARFLNTAASDQAKGGHHGIKGDF